MTTQSSMIKRISGAGVLTDKTPDLFKRNGSRFRGIASFDGNSSVILEVADTPELKQKGLSGRTSMPECCGMLFTNLCGGSFWMKGCKIPLDIVFIDASDKVSLKYSMQADGGKRRYGYRHETTAIELPYGFCNRHGIAVGTKCHWRTW